jgi:hypothetical protein
MALVGSGIVGPGFAEYFEVVLRAGGIYQVYVNSFEPAIDFDLDVYDENGSVVTIDETIYSDAYGTISPRRTGPFRFVVTAARGASGYRIAVEE